MKKKIISVAAGIIILISTVMPVASFADKNEIRTISYDADIPTWKVGDKWEYHFIESVIGYYPLTYSLSGYITFEVVEDTGDSYVLEAFTRPKGLFDLGSIGLKTTMLTTLSMKLQVRKTDLALENFYEKIKGIFLVTVGPITLPIALQAVGNSDIEFDPPWVIMPFPLSDGKCGNLSGTEFVYTNYYMNLFWGLVPALGPFNRTWPMTSLPYTCSQELVSVEAGTFNVFNVSAEWIDGSKFMSYYANEVGNVVKEVIYIPYSAGGVRHSLILELKDCNYTP